MKTSSEQMLEFVERITIALEKIAINNKEVTNLESKNNPNLSKIIPNCPLCGEPMLLRKRKADQSDFWGCRNFPNCKGTCNEDGTPTKNMPPLKTKESHNDVVPF